MADETTTDDNVDRELTEAAEAGDTAAMVRLALAFASRGELGAARQQLERAATLGDTDALFVRGVVEDAAGDAQAAFAFWAQAAEAGNGDAMFNLAVSAQQSGDSESSAAWLAHAAEAGNGRALHNLGVQAEAAGNAEEAESNFRRAAEAGWPGSMAALGTVLDRRDQPAEAAEWYGKALDAGFEDAEIEYRYGVCLGRTGQETQARTHLLRAAGAKHARAALTLGDLARGAGQQPDAEYWYTTANSLGESAGLLGLSLLRADEGDFREAERLLSEAGEAGNTQAAALLTDLKAARTNAGADDAGDVADTNNEA